MHVGRWKQLRVILAGLIAVVSLGAVQAGSALAETTSEAPTATCLIASPSGQIQHVISIMFNGVELSRANPNVPSDLEQMPNLLNFIEGNGTLLANQHAVPQAHAAVNLLTSLTGLYPDRHGVPIGNSYRAFNPDGTSDPASAFTYWTAPVTDPDSPSTTGTTYNMVTDDGSNTPAPWVPFTRAGCTVGAVAIANMVIENPSVDVPLVFGADSAEAETAALDPDRAMTDLAGVALHCAKDDDACSAKHGGVTDRLPDEPGGYEGFRALFGHKRLASLIGGNEPLTDINGDPIQDADGHDGFPGFNAMSADVALGYVAAMQEHDVPVTYAYISDPQNGASGDENYLPGEAGYVAQLAAYDAAFGRFFDRLAESGITPANTLFVFSTDQGDHFVGGEPTPEGCDGITVPCSYEPIGSSAVNLTGLLATQQGQSGDFSLVAGSAPSFYVDGNPAPNAEATRALERAAGAVTATNPVSGDEERVSVYLAGAEELRNLHMQSGDPARNPNFVLFANPDYYLYDGPADCSTGCQPTDADPAWNTGTIAPDITQVWADFVGPGVRHLGQDESIWADHADLRPTMMALLGLQDSYVPDGRILAELLEPAALPAGIASDRAAYIDLARVYKQLNAPLGDFGMLTLRISTAALRSDTPGDAYYTRLASLLDATGNERDAVATTMRAALNKVAFEGSDLSAAQPDRLKTRGRTLIGGLKLFTALEGVE